MKCIFNLSLILTFVFSAQIGFSQSEINMDKSAEVIAQEAKESKDESEIFKNYSWLKEIVNQEKCEGTTITLRSSSKNSVHKYLIVEDGDTMVMYNTKGDRYCSNTKTVNCIEFYSLDTEEDSWKCK